MKDQHTKSTGYRDLTQNEIDLMNKIKAVGQACGALVDELRSYPADTGVVPDQRWVSIGATDLQTGIMALVRSVAKPISF